MKKFSRSLKMVGVITLFFLYVVISAAVPISGIRCNPRKTSDKAATSKDGKAKARRETRKVPR